MTAIENGLVSVALVATMDDDLTTVTLHAVVRLNQVQDLEETIAESEYARARSLARRRMFNALADRLRSGEIDYPTFKRLRDELSTEDLPITFPAEWDRDES